MPKFFVKSAFKDGSVIISGDDYKHIVKVHRKLVGDNITLCDGKGTDMNCKIRQISKNEIVLDILEAYECRSEPKTKIILFQGIPKQGKMETIIQKTTELGVYKIVPVQTHRSIVKINISDHKKLDRWQRVALEAAKQCGRGIVPKVENVTTLEEAIMQMAQMQLAIMPYENEEKQKLSDLLNQNINEVGLLVGPEGGFEQTEVELARSKGIKTVTLGKRILRTETVGAAVLPIILYAVKDL